jgi:hypothetical protein
MDSRKVVVRRTKKFGRGVFAVKPIRRGETVAVFDGLVYDDDHEDWNDDIYNHAIQFARNMWRDSKGIARLINHSCEPNCGIRNLFRIVAMRDIRAGEQITWDYEMTEKSDNWSMRCKCGSNICRRRIGNYQNMPKHIREKYGTFISAWLRRSGRPKRRKITV